MTKIQGYAHIKPYPETGISPEPIEKFAGEIVRVIEWERDGSGILCVDSQATGLAQFDHQDILRSFKCEEFAGVLIPPGLSVPDQMLYATKVQTREGGYNLVMRRMVIAASLAKGRFFDDFLFQQSTKTN